MATNDELGTLTLDSANLTQKTRKAYQDWREAEQDISLNQTMAEADEAQTLVDKDRAETAEVGAAGRVQSLVDTSTSGVGAITPAANKVPMTNADGEIEPGYIDWSQIRLAKLQSPLVHLFAPNKLVDTLDGALSWTRASEATYVDRYGVVKTAAIDEPREEAEGFLIEGASTNNLLQSSNTDGWLAVGPDIGNLVAAPDGTLTAREFAWNGISGQNTLQQHVSVLAGETWTISIFVRQSDTNPADGVIFEFGSTPNVWTRIKFNFSTETLTPNTGGLNEFAVKMDNGWWRIGFTKTMAADESERATVVFNSEYPNMAAYWGWQAEKLPFPTSYIPTSGAAATRAADEVIIPVVNCPLYADNMTTAMVVAPLMWDEPNVWRHVYSVYGPNTSRFHNTVYHNVSGFAARSDSVAASVGSGYVLPLNSVPCFAAVAMEADGYRFHVDSSVKQVSRDADATATLYDIIYIGGTNGAANDYYGHLRNFRIYDFALNAHEVALLSQGGA